MGNWLTQDSQQFKARDPGGRKGRKLGANCRMSREISGPAGGAGEDSGVNVNAQVLVQARLRIFTGNRQKWLEGGVITDRSVTNQRESSAPVAVFASRQNCVMSRRRGHHEDPAYMHLVSLSPSPCFMDESE